MENRRLRRVQIFGFIIAQYPAAKGNDPTPRVKNRKDNAIAKTIVSAAAVIGNQHAAIGESLDLLGVVVCSLQ